MNKKDLSNFLESFTDDIDKEKKQLFKNIIDSSRIENFENAEEFFFSILYPWEKFISGFIKTNISDNRDVEYIYKNFNKIDRHFAKQFQEYEGSACSSDKSRTVVKALLSFFSTGEKIKFNYNQEYTFHLPKKIFKTHSEIIDFYEAIKSLDYGNADKYIKIISA